eukprot:2797946-Prymnesium_polylepis.1
MAGVHTRPRNEPHATVPRSPPGTCTLTLLTAEYLCNTLLVLKCVPPGTPPHPRTLNCARWPRRPGPPRRRPTTASAPSPTPSAPTTRSRRGRRACRPRSRAARGTPRAARSR